MNQSQITMPALLSMPFRPLRKWMVERSLVNSSRKVEVMEWQRMQLDDELKREHIRQVHLKAKQMQIERGL